MVTKYLIQDKSNILYSLGDMKYADNIIPKMVNNENDEIKLTCSDYYVGKSSTNFHYSPYLITDRKIDKGWNFEGSEGEHWLKIQFKNKPKRVQKITLCNGNSPSISIKNFKIQGSNDDINYKDLYINKHPYGEFDTTKAEYEFNNNTNYYYYKIIVIDSYYSNSTTYGGIGELEMMEKTISKVDILGNNLTEDLFKNKGFDDPTTIQNQQINEKSIYVIDKGTLGEGKVFEFNLSDDIKTIKNIE